MTTAMALRSRSLDETEWLVERLLERLGVTRVSDVTGLDVVGIPVYQSVRPRAARGLNTVTSGKGQTHQAARVSAMMEAVERYYCEPAGRHSQFRTYESLSQETNTLDPRRLVPRRGHTWTAQTPLHWWPMHCLSTGLDVHVPAVAVFTPFPAEADLMRSNTIGLAAGNDAADAALQGLYEVIEHDSTAFGEKLGLGYRIQPDSIPEGHRQLVECFERASIRVTVHAYTGGLPVPTFFVITEDLHAQDGMLFNGGAGCHLNPDIALARALTEAAQSRLAVIAGSREDLAEQAYRRHSSYDELRQFLHAWSEGRPWLPYSSIPNRSTGNNDGDRDMLLKVLREADLQMVLDSQLSPDGLPFSVNKIVVPGTEFTHVDHRRVGHRLMRANGPAQPDWIATWR